MDRGRATQAPFAFALISGIFAASALLPVPGADGRILHLPTICPFYNLTGLPCPGCGLTRSFVCLAHGHIAQSCRWHPLGPALFCILGVIWLQYGAWLLRRRPLFTLSAQRKNALSGAGVVAFLVFGVARTVYFAITHRPF
ncbi:MAG: DUF2752 domain-containing protein [Capsulimonadaceae bacterium]